MLKTLELLKNSDIIKSYSILDFKSGENFYFLKIKAEISDGSELFIREYVSEKEYLYSYHWQDKNGSLRIRWDNSPHHVNLRTFPHHQHTPDLEESEEIGLEDVLKRIRRTLGRE